MGIWEEKQKCVAWSQQSACKETICSTEDIIMSPSPVSGFQRTKGKSKTYFLTRICHFGAAHFECLNTSNIPNVIRVFFYAYYIILTASCYGSIYVLLFYLFTQDAELKTGFYFT